MIKTHYRPDSTRRSVNDENKCEECPDDETIQCSLCQDYICDDCGLEGLCPDCLSYSLCYEDYCDEHQMSFYKGQICSKCVF